MEKNSPLPGWGLIILKRCSQNRTFQQTSVHLHISVFNWRFHHFYHSGIIILKKQFKEFQSVLIFACGKGMVCRCRGYYFC